MVLGSCTNEAIAGAHHTANACDSVGKSDGSGVDCPAIVPIGINYNIIAVGQLFDR